MEFERVSPESVGLSSRAVESMLDELYRCGIEMHSFMLLRHGKVCAEGAWHPYKTNTQHIMFSFSKSLTSTAIGFAQQEGILSIDEKLIDIFPDKSPENPCENLQKATLRHVLMMGCGHDTEIEWINDVDPEWISTFLHHPFVHEPGSTFMYNTAGTNLLSAVITRKTGLTLTEFLRPRLIEPLGMSNIHCHAMSDGTEMGGAGYYLTIEDMARFVQFVANKGEWQGKQLLNSAWFEDAAAKHIENYYTAAESEPDWRQGYGYQFWRCQPEGVFRGDGAFGQYGIVMTKQDAVLVIQSASLRLQHVLTSVWEKLLPEMKENPLPEDPKAFESLKKRLAALELNPLLSVRNDAAESSLNGAVYVPNSPLPAITDIIAGIGKYEPDGGSLLSIGFKFAPDGSAALICNQDNGTVEIKIGMEGHFVITNVGGVPYGANGSWRSHNKLEVELRNTTMASGKRFVFRFEGSKLTVNADSTMPTYGGLAGELTPEMIFTCTDGEVSTKAKMYWEYAQD